MPSGNCFTCVKCVLFVLSFCNFCFGDDIQETIFRNTEDEAGQLSTLPTTTFSDSLYPDYNFQVLESHDDETTPLYDLMNLGGSENITHVWNASTYSAKDYQQSVCLQRCQQSSIVNITSYTFRCRSVACMPCTCSRPACEVYNTCCPDITEPYIPPQGLKGDLYATGDRILGYKRYLASPPKVEVDTNIEQSGKNEMALGCDDESGKAFFLYVRSCLPQEPGFEKLVRFCEEELPFEEISVDVITRVADKATGIIYRNRFCAQCNGVQEIVSFMLDIRCKHYMKLYTATEPAQLLRMIKAQNEICRIRQREPRNVVLENCKPAVFFDPTNKIIGSCDNAFSEWEYDEEIARACLNMWEPIYRVSTGVKGVYYKNVFCAICHENSYPFFNACKPSGSIMHRTIPINPPFQLLINFGTRPLAKKSLFKIVSLNLRNCSEAEWTSPNDECLPLLCAPGKNLANGNCITVLPEIKGLGYSFNVWFVPKGEQSEQVIRVMPYIPETYLLDNLKIKLQEIISTISDDYKITIAVISSDSERLDERQTFRKPIVFWVSAKIVADMEMPRDEFERTLTENLLTPILNVSIANGVEADFLPSVRLSDCPVGVSNISASLFCSNLTDQSPSNLHTCNVSKIPPGNNRDTYIWEEQNSFLNISHLLTCSFVKLNKSSFHLTTIESVVPPAVTIKIDLNRTMVIIDDIIDLTFVSVDDEGNLCVCRELLDKKIRNSGDADQLEISILTDADANRTAQYILTMVFLGTSMLCLLLTLFSYLRFPVMLTTAGRNNACLSLSLLLAQSFLIASTHLSPPSFICTAVGILTHGSWLWMFTWTFICSFNMFRVFTAKTRATVSAHEQNMQLLKKIAGSLACPVCIVATVIIASHFTSSTFGYGDEVCYLDSTLLLGVSLVGPLAVCLTCNIAFFLTTVITIYRIHKLQSSDSVNSSDKKNLFIYIKLSSMTGAFWIMAIISEAVDSDVLRYISIFLNGLQGVFVFVSFMCNKRVLHLYLGRHEQTSTHFQRETTETVDMEDSTKLNARVASAVRFVHLRNPRRENV